MLWTLVFDLAEEEEEVQNLTWGIPQDGLGWEKLTAPSSKSANCTLLLGDDAEPASQSHKHFN